MPLLYYQKFLVEPVVPKIRNANVDENEGAILKVSDYCLHRCFRNSDVFRVNNVKCGQGMLR